MKTLTVPARRWYDNEERVLSFPDNWDVDQLTAPGLEKPGLSPSQIRSKIENPIIMDAPEGQATHYVFRSWGKDYGGTQYVLHAPGTRFVPHVMKRLIIFNPSPDPNCVDVICHKDDVLLVKTWEECLAILQEEYPGSARVAVIPDGTMQFMRDR